MAVFQKILESWYDDSDGQLGLAIHWSKIIFTSKVVVLSRTVTASIADINEVSDLPKQQPID